MSQETTRERDNSMDKLIEDQHRLASLMGEHYNGMEMQDYFAYLKPEITTIEIDMFEKKLKTRQGPEWEEKVIEAFKAHLAYLALN